MLDNFEQSELSHTLWLEFAEAYQKKHNRPPTEADRMIWKTAFRVGFCEGRKEAIGI